MIDQTKDKLEIELTSKCVIQCPACSRMFDIENKSIWDAGHLDKELLFNIADTTNFWKYTFCGCYGDAIYHPDFLEICNYFIKKRKYIQVHTNGSAKPEKFWQAAAEQDWKGSDFTFSIDGLEDTNHIYRINSKWKQIMTGVKYMTSIPKERRPRLEWKMIIFKYNEHQVNTARQMARDLGFDMFTPVESTRSIEEYGLKPGEGNPYV
jgi:MoaA/NifB/PqqE/SkfB family radical SAM enzyme